MNNKNFHGQVLIVCINKSCTHTFVLANELLFDANQGLIPQPPPQLMNQIQNEKNIPTPQPKPPEQNYNQYERYNYENQGYHPNPNTTNNARNYTPNNYGTQQTFNNPPQNNNFNHLTTTTTTQTTTSLAIDPQKTSKKDIMNLLLDSTTIFRLANKKLNLNPQINTDFENIILTEDTPSNISNQTLANRLKEFIITNLQRNVAFLKLTLDMENSIRDLIDDNTSRKRRDREYDRDHRNRDYNRNYSYDRNKERDNKPTHKSPRTHNNTTTYTQQSPSPPLVNDTKPPQTTTQNQQTESKPQRPKRETKKQPPPLDLNSIVDNDNDEDSNQDEDNDYNEDGNESSSSKTKSLSSRRKNTTKKSASQ